MAFPYAECKIFLTASREERARRRYEELISRGEPSTFDESWPSSTIAIGGMFRVRSGRRSKRPTPWK